MDMTKDRVRKPALAVVTVALFAAAALYSPANYAEYFLKQPGLVLVGCTAAFIAYLPSLWVIRKLDRQPYAWPIYAAIVLFMALTAPLVSEVTWSVINRGVRYWQIVGLTEETAKILPVVLCLLIFPGMVRNTRDGLVIGALAGLGFACIEFGVGFALDNFPERGWLDLRTSLPARWALGTEMHILWGATTGAAIGYFIEAPKSRKRFAAMFAIMALVMLTHGVQDFMGKYIGPLSIGVVGGLVVSAGIPETVFQDGGPWFVALMIVGAVINTLLINVFILPILWRLLHLNSPTDNEEPR